jgi:hypothetical protein
MNWFVCIGMTNPHSFVVLQRGLHSSIKLMMFGAQHTLVGYNECDVKITITDPLREYSQHRQVHAWRG